MNDDKLREEVRVLKAIGKIKCYYDVAQEIGTTEKSFYNWLNGYYKLGYTKKKLLCDYIGGIKNGTIQ